MIDDGTLTAEARVVSLDGRRFQFAGPLEPGFEPGGFVTLRPATGALQLGQVEDVAFTIGGDVHGGGRILGAIPAEGGAPDSRLSVPFPMADMRPAAASMIAALYDGVAASLAIGSHLVDGDVPAHLLPRRLNRHTFWCGQSGSGKTYALGVLLEQILLRTSLPMVIFDPNADFVRMRESDGRSAPPAARRLLAERDIRILRPTADGADALRVRFVDLPIQSRAAVLRLHPLDDRAEYNELVRLEETVGTLDSHAVVPRLLERRTPAALDLAARIQNLGLVDWNVWARGSEPVTAVIDARPDATVLDLGGFTAPDEPLVVALAVLDDLWAQRERRRPILIVIDEAHNLCAPDGGSPLRALVRERIVQIAAEGRKFGLWLLLSTQRPSRIDPSILSQCDNLALMKMTSAVDLDDLARTFGFVPAGILARATGFRQGEALFAGGFAPAPSVVRVGVRLTREGGADVPVPVRGG